MFNAGLKLIDLDWNRMNHYRRDRVLLRQQVFVWLEDVTDLRVKLFDAIDKLYELSSNDNILIKAHVVEKATNCHLRPSKKDKMKNTCLVCISNSHLKKYEGTLFNMSHRTKTFEEMSLKGSWKPTFQELTLKGKFPFFEIIFFLVGCSCSYELKNFIHLFYMKINSFNTNASLSYLEE